MEKLCSITGIICLVYFLVLGFYTKGWGGFKLFWLFSGAALLFLSFLWKRGIFPGFWEARPWAGKGILFFLAAGVIVAAFLEGMVIGGMMEKCKDGAEYLLVLGAQIRGTTISRSLKFRLDRALEYADKNRNTTLIVSGGQGSGELVTEARAMKQYLVAHGMDASRIVEEDASVNTEQNIRFCRAIIERRGEKAGSLRVLIVSNNFHIFRAKRLALKQGFTKAEGLPAKTDPVVLPHYMLREAAAIVKDYLFGHI